MTFIKISDHLACKLVYVVPCALNDISWQLHLRVLIYQM